MTEPLWQNEHVEIHEDGIDYHHRNLGWLEATREEIEAGPIDFFRMATWHYGADRKALYDAFLQLATYWDLKVDFDELRKIRDEMKEAQL